MQKLVPHLWYDKEAKEAAELYTSLFPNSKINNVTTIKNTPSGDADMVSFELWGQEFMSISAGPYFKFTPAISFIVNFDPLLFGGANKDKEAREKLDEVWNKLIDGGMALMPLDKYPFSERYGWLQDKYGLSWQLMLTDPMGEPRPPIIPSMLFVGDKCGKAGEAIQFYLSVFKNSKMGALHRYGPNQAPDKEGTVMFADFMLEDKWLSAMDSAHEHKFDFNEAVSLLINCNDQAEIDYFWEKMSAVPAAEQCGWIKDKYGVSWQINAADMNTMLTEGSPEQVDRVVKAFLPMKKFDLAKLKAAYEGK